MFKTKRYTITFDKHIFVENCTTKRVPDSFLLEALKKLEEDFNNLKVIKVDFSSTGSDCKVIIRCRKDDKLNVVHKYCKLLDDTIEKISIR